MGFLSRVGELARDELKALLSVSTFEQRTPGYGTDEEQADRIREALGGNISPLPVTRTRWYLSDLEQAIKNADSGDMAMAAQLYRSMRKDGVWAGLIASCTDGLVRLPKRFYGDKQQIEQLAPRNGTRSVFDEMAPPQELALLASDGRMLGVGVGELVPVQGRDYPVLRRLEPEFLRYRWSEGRWYFQSVSGTLPITPGDGRWVLHVPGGHMAPWQFGLWMANGRSFINKDHALLHRGNYSAKLANPARAAIAPIGATQDERIGFLSRLISWGVNTVFELPIGWDVKLIESNGTGFECFQNEIATSDNEYMISIAGQVVTTTGGTGFANADIHKSIRADIIQAIADSLAYTVNTQIIPPWVVHGWGIEAIRSRAVMEWDVRPAKDRLAEANSLIAAASAMKVLREELAKYGESLDVMQMVHQFGVAVASESDPATDDAVESGIRPKRVVDVAPDMLDKLGRIAKSAGLQITQESIGAVCAASGLLLEPVTTGATLPHIELAPTDEAKIWRVDEVREARGGLPVGDERGAKMVAEVAMKQGLGAGGAGTNPNPELAEEEKKEAEADAADAPSKETA